jgi:NAD dependent epimerase/dehydratase family enzyme
VRHALENEQLSGPVNATAPEPVTNRQFTKTLGRVLGRPTVMRVPGPALRLALGEFSTEVLNGQRVLPARLTESGYRFQYPQLEGALRHLLEK